MTTLNHNHSPKSSAKPRPTPVLFSRQIKKVEQDLLQLRLQYRHAPAEKKLAIMRQAEERKSFLEKLHDAEKFWKKP